MQANMGMAGEFRAVVKRADGSTKIDTGYQKNLILNQGLDFFGGGKGTDMMTYCVIGSGNSPPVYTQNKLDTGITGVSGADFSTKYDYDASRDGNLYKVNKVRKYSFSGLGNINISEVGLASTYSSTSNYYLCTRALIKDSKGNPTTITILSGEVLEIYYKLWFVMDVSDKDYTVNLLDGVGGSQSYKCKIRPTYVGTAAYVQNWSSIGWNLNYVGDDYGIKTGWVASTDLGSINNTINGESKVYPSVSGYVAGSYKLNVTYSAGVNVANIPIRSLAIITSMGNYQFRFGSVANDSPITKTNTKTLSIPIEISWGRYEGAL